LHILRKAAFKKGGSELRRSGLSSSVYCVPKTNNVSWGQKTFETQGQDTQSTGSDSITQHRKTCPDFESADISLACHTKARREVAVFSAARFPLRMCAAANGQLYKTRSRRVLICLAGTNCPSIGLSGSHVRYLSLHKAFANSTARVSMAQTSYNFHKKLFEKLLQSLIFRRTRE